MKVIRTDNHGLDRFDEVLIQENVTPEEGRQIAYRLNMLLSEESDYCYVVVSADYSLLCCDYEAAARHN